MISRHTIEAWIIGKRSWLKPVVLCNFCGIVMVLVTNLQANSKPTSFFFLGGGSEGDQIQK